MLTKEPGLVYELESLPNSEVQTIRFVGKVEGTLIPGTTNEEVTQMMIERFYHLQDQKFSVDNQIIIEHLKSIRRLLVKRQKGRKVLNHNSIENEKETIGYDFG